jgi:hypothetical protein
VFWQKKKKKKGQSRFFEFFFFGQMDKLFVWHNFTFNILKVLLNSFNTITNMNHLFSSSFFPKRKEKRKRSGQCNKHPKKPTNTVQIKSKTIENEPKN